MTDFMHEGLYQQRVYPQVLRAHPNTQTHLWKALMSELGDSSSGPSGRLMLPV